MTIKEFKRKFPDEWTCRRYFFNLRFPDGFCCPYCQHCEYYYVASRDLLECRACRMQTSLTSGTFMHGTKLPMLYWFTAIFLVVSGRPCTASGLTKTLSINYRSALNMLRKIRQVIELENGNLHRMFKQKVDFSASSTKGQPDIVQQAKQIMLNKAQAYLSRVYRTVKMANNEFNRYFEEFYYLKARKTDPERFFTLLKAHCRMPLFCRGV